MSDDRAERAAALLAALPPRPRSGSGGAVRWDVALIEEMLRLREDEKLTFPALSKRMGISRQAIDRFRTLSGWHPAPVRLDRGVHPIAKPTYSAINRLRRRQRRRIAQSEELRP
jgi:predicted DNA-binding transcriptional regulator AlpA